MDQEAANSVLREIYYNPASPGSFGGAQVLFKAARAAGHGVSVANVRQFLDAQTTYQKHARVHRTHAASDRFIVKEPFHLWQGDLAQYKLPPYNFILVVIDSFSKKGFFEPVRTKNGPDMVHAFKAILRRGMPPKSYAVKRFLTDRGKEFYNQHMLKLYADERIYHYSIQKGSDIGGGASMAERLIRTLGERLQRYETEYNVGDAVELLHQIERSYNGTYQSTIRMAPDELHVPAYKRHAMDPMRVLKAAMDGKFVWEDRNLVVARELMNTTVGRNKRPHQWDRPAQENLKNIGRPLQEGDWVRIYREKGHFEKGHKPNWSEETFKISQKMAHNPNKYIIEDDGANKIIGSFYRDELLKLPEKPVAHPIKIIKSRKKRGQLQYFVQWVDEPDSEPEWISARSLIP